MTAGERLAALAGASGKASALLLVIGLGNTAGAALVDYSGLPSGTAAQHLLADGILQPFAPVEEVGGDEGKHKAVAKAKIAEPEVDLVREAILKDDELILQLIVDVVTKELI